MGIRNKSANPSDKPFTGRHMLSIMLAFFGIIIIVNLTLAVLAGRSWTGLEVKNSYVASQDYNAKLAVADRQRARGWHSKLVHNGNALTLTVTTSSGRAVRGARIDAQLRRPVQESDDRLLAFKETGPGVYRAITPPQSGSWDVSVQVFAPGEEPYRQVFRIMVKE